METIEEKKVTFVQIFPEILNLMMKSENLKELRGVKHVLLGGYKLDEEFVAEARKIFPCAEIFAAYGTTETSFGTSGIVKKYFGSSGVVRPNFRIKVRF